jgi:hypothetical protein
VADSAAISSYPNPVYLPLRFVPGNGDYLKSTSAPVRVQVGP